MNQNSKQIAREFEDIETNLMYDLLLAVDILIEDIDRRFRQKGARFAQKKKRDYNIFINKLRGAMVFFDQVMDNDYWIGSSESVYQYDKMKLESNELIILLMLYIDRVAKNHDNIAKIVDYIKSLESCNVIDEEELEWFNRIKL